jgi:hypothetical protein
LRETNIGLCKKSGKTFGEVMAHFIIGLDEMCIMSDAHGDCYVIAASDKKKHERATNREGLFYLTTHEEATLDVVFHLS